MLYILLSQSRIVFKLTCTSLVACLCNFEGNIGLNVRKRGRKEGSSTSRDFKPLLWIFLLASCQLWMKTSNSHDPPPLHDVIKLHPQSLFSARGRHFYIFPFFYIRHVFTAVMIQQPWDNQGYLTYHPLECPTFLQNVGFISKFYTCKYNPLKTF